MIMFKHSYSFLTIFILNIVFIFSCSTKDGKENKTNTLDTLVHSQQANPYVPYDQSPMDMSYYPPDYPLLKMNGTDTSAPVARVIYSRPQKKGRVIFGSTEQSLRQYGKEWRLGANEATEIEFFRDVIIAEKKINKGRYIIYCTPYAGKWTIVLNNNLYTWGLHMDVTKDIFKTDIPVLTQSPVIEDFTMQFLSAPSGAELIMTWDNVKTVLPISFSK